MPVTMSGISSGMDTDAIINKLIEVERQPIRQLEIDKRQYQSRKKALNQLKGHLEDIEKRAKDLYGFRASFDDKKALSSDPAVLEASASKKAKEGTTRVQVIKRASTHKIASDPVKGTVKLPSGKFSISVKGEKYAVTFKGGRIKTLKQKIEEDASEIVSTSLIKSTGDSYVLTLESKVPGEKGEMLIKGAKNFLKKIGLIKGEKGEDKSRVAIVFDRRYFKSYEGDKTIDKQDGTLNVSKDGNSIDVQGMLWQEYLLPVESKVKKDTLLTFDFTHKEKGADEEPVPFRVELGPEERTVIKGIELKGYNVSRLRKIEKKEKKKFDSVLGVGVVVQEKNKRNERLYIVDKGAKGKQEIPIGNDFSGKKIHKIIFYCNEGTTTFANAKIVTPLKGKGLLDPKNEITKPANAVLKIDGIEVERDKNEGLTDLIEGVTLNINGTSKRPVSVSVSPDTEKALETITGFVEAYNKYLDYHKELIKTERATKPGQRNKYERGLFVGDMTIVRLESTLRRVVNNSYPSREENPVKMFPQMGISTGDINAAWETIKEGKLVVDAGKVEETLRENPDGVKSFFGSDTDGDNRVDNGMAYTVVNTLKPYVSFGKNIIVNKIDLENENIKLANDRIERQEEHLKKYEEKLRKKFATMEKALTGAKAQKNWMNQQMGTTPQKEK